MRKINDRKEKLLKIIPFHCFLMFNLIFYYQLCFEMPHKIYLRINLVSRHARTIFAEAENDNVLSEKTAKAGGQAKEEN